MPLNFDNSLEGRLTQNPLRAIIPTVTLNHRRRIQIRISQRKRHKEQSVRGSQTPASGSLASMCFVTHGLFATGEAHLSLDVQKFWGLLTLTRLSDCPLVDLCQSPPPKSRAGSFWQGQLSPPTISCGRPHPTIWCILSGMTQSPCRKPSTRARPRLRQILSWAGCLASSLLLTSVVPPGKCKVRGACGTSWRPPFVSGHWHRIPVTGGHTSQSPRGCHSPLLRHQRCWQGRGSGLFRVSGCQCPGGSRTADGSAS